ncbi:MAG: hypothetical protein AAFV01_13410, partial [Bacteroidota bacterium]
RGRGHCVDSTTNHADRKLVGVHPPPPASLATSRQSSRAAASSEITPRSFLQRFAGLQSAAGP